MATGKYTVFLVKELVESADAYFLPGYHRTYFIFTDGHVPQADNVVRIEQKRLGWPYDTMMRFSVYWNAASYFEKIDYLFACDADMLFVNMVGDEILGERVATRHPGFTLPDQRHDDYQEMRPQPPACVMVKGFTILPVAFMAAAKKNFYGWHPCALSILCRILCIPLLPNGMMKVISIVILLIIHQRWLFAHLIVIRSFGILPFCATIVGTF